MPVGVGVVERNTRAAGSHILYEFPSSECPQWVGGWHSDLL